jgi:hypothetical protein
MADNVFINGPCDGCSTSPTAEFQLAVQRDVVCHQLDDLNALGDALAVAAQENDAERIASLRESLARYALAAGWLAETPLAPVLAYVEAHGEFDEDLFAPAFILSAVAPDHPQTVALLARLPEPVRALLALATPARPRP